MSDSRSRAGPYAKPEAPGIGEFGSNSGSPTIRWVSMVREDCLQFADATAPDGTTRRVRAGQSETIGATLHKRLGVLTFTSPGRPRVTHHLVTHQQWRRVAK